MSGNTPSLPLRDVAFCDLSRELGATRGVLERLPEDKLTWKVHEKSMSFGRLATHVATLMQWFHSTLVKDEFDMNMPPKMPTELSTRAELLKVFDENASAVKAALAATDDAALLRDWTLRRGEQILLRKPRHEILRVWCLNHLVHHRAQLCIYLRMHNIPVPAIYFNSADEPDWKFD